MNTLAILTLAGILRIGTDIVALHPEREVLPPLLAARAEGGSWDKPAAEKPLTLLHFSDLHGSCENLERIVAFRNAYSEYIDDAIHTGDAVSSYMDDANPWTKVRGAGGIINVIGNHDCWKGHRTWAETDIPYDASAEEAYGIFIAPFIGGWGVVQPEGVTDRTSDRYCGCYFYKDYPQSKVRLIALDCIHYDDAQDLWFDSALKDAARKGYAVVGAQHYFSQTGLESLDTGFSSGPGIAACADPDRPQIECSPERIFTTLDRFMDAGGVFVCWLSGHEHEDYIGFVRGHSRQLQILVEKAGEKDVYIHEDRTEGTVNQDAFNLVTVNPSKHLLVIQRIGSTRGPKMRSKTLFAYDYAERTVSADE